MLWWRPRVANNTGNGNGNRSGNGKLLTAPNKSQSKWLKLFDQHCSFVPFLCNTRTLHAHSLAHTHTLTHMLHFTLERPLRLMPKMFRKFHCVSINVLFHCSSTKLQFLARNTSNLITFPLSPHKLSMSYNNYASKFSIEWNKTLYV